MGAKRHKSAADAQAIPTRHAMHNGKREGPSITFVTPRKKRLDEVTGSDIPPGLDPEDVATDYPERPWE